MTLNAGKLKGHYVIILLLRFLKAKVEINVIFVFTTKQ